MRSRFLAFFLFAHIALPCLLFAQDGSGLAVSLDPAVAIPLPGSPSASSFSLGFQGSVNADYTFPSSPLVVGGSFDFGYAPGTGWNLTTLGLSAGPGVRLRLLPTLSAILWGRAGYLFGMLGQASAPNPYLRAGVDLSLYLWPTVRLTLGGEYDHQFAASQAQYQGLAVRLGAGFNFSQINQRSRVEIRDIILSPVFPVFYKYYNDNKVGTVTVRNGEDGPVKNVKVSFYVKQYMDAPKECAVIPEMKQGEQREVPLYALFTRPILGILEPTKAQAQITVTYTYSERDREATSATAATINHRNGMTWDDDRHVASFATVNDPTVLAMAKTAAGIARASGFVSFDTALRQGIGIFEELGLYGLLYVPDPNLPYSTTYKNQLAVDYLQFPAQTLQYKSGDCDDLSIVYASMLEAAGVTSAFITVPGHIYAAFALGMPLEKAQGFFARPEDLIVRGDTAWVPVEVTLVQEGFLRAWQIGAREWREASAQNQAHFIETHEAWKLFEPVANIGSDQPVPLPAADKLAQRYSAAMAGFVDRQIGARVQSITAEIAAAPKDPRPLNKLGALYARYEQMDTAEQQFRKALAAREFEPAFLNLGNVLMRKSDFSGARAAYQNALRIAPNDPAALVGLVRSSYELDDSAAATRWLDRLTQADPAAAGKLAYVRTGDSATTRAGEAGQEELQWAE